MANQQKQARDVMAIELSDVALGTLTDVLMRACRQLLERKRGVLDGCPDIRSVTITIKLTDKGQIPYKMFLTPQHESHPD